MKKRVAALLLVTAIIGGLIGNKEYISANSMGITEKTNEKTLRCDVKTIDGDTSDRYRFIEKGEIPKSEENKVINIRCDYGDKNQLDLQFSNIGVNQKTQLSSVKILDELGNVIKDRSYNITTDLVSPYGILQVSKDATDLCDKPITVGGCHGSLGSYGYPTSKNESLKIEIDGKEITSNEINNISGNEVKITTVSKILPSNYNFPKESEKNEKKEEPKGESYSVRETVEYIITEGNVEVKVDLETLRSKTQEDQVKITNYTGLQGVAYKYNKLYFMDSEKDGFYGLNEDLKINLNKKGRVVDRFVLMNEKNLENDKKVPNDIFVGYIDRNYKLGKLDYVYDGFPNVTYMSESKKVYLKNVCTSPSKCPIVENDGSMSYRGGYSFVENEEVGENSVFYPIKIDGKTIYTVDSYGEDEITIQMPKEFVGKKIKIESTTTKDAFKTDGIITPAGIMVNALKPGQLQFTIDDSVDDTLEVKTNGKTTKVAFKYDKDSDMIFTFLPYGNNQLIQMINANKVENKDVKASINGTVIKDNYAIKNEWISPYVISTKNTTEDDKFFEVGGNAVFKVDSNDKAEKNTAKPIGEAKVEVDGKIIGKHQVIQGNEVVVTVVNEIAPWNEIDKLNNEENYNVTEIVKYTITKNKVDIEVELQAKEDVVLSKNAGLKCRKTIFTEAGFYNEDNSRNADKTLWFNVETGFDNSNSQVGSGTKSQNKIEAFGLRNNQDTIIGYMDRTVGLGNLEFLDDNSQIALFNKNIFTMYNVSKIVEINKGNSVKYKAGYIFQSNR